MNMKKKLIFLGACFPIMIFLIFSPEVWSASIIICLLFHTFHFCSYFQYPAGVPGGVPYPVEFSARALILAGVVFGFNSKSPLGESTLINVPLLPPEGVPTNKCVGRRG